MSRFRRSSQPEPVVYDKAKYHYDGDWPEGLDRRQAFVHTGMYLGWLVLRNLVLDSEFDGSDGAAARRDFLSRAMTGPALFDYWFDGVLVDTSLSAEGNRFTEHYFDFATGNFLADYDSILTSDLASMYEVPDTWANFDLLAARLDQRLAEWRTTQS